MTKKVTTKSGAVYMVNEEDGFWKKNNEPVERILFCHGIYPDDLIWWHHTQPYDQQPIKVGTHLYIGSKDVWWLSTPIISVEEIEDVEPNP